MLKKPKPSTAELRRHATMIRSIGMCVAELMRPEPCGGELQSCHVRIGGGAGIAQKPPKREVPMCALHHSIQHKVGEKTFWGERLNEVITLACVLGVMTDDLEQAQFECMEFRYGY